MTNRFEWRRHPEAEAFVQARLDDLARTLPPLEALRADMLARTSTQLYDWIDHLVLGDEDALRGQLADLGFEVEDMAALAGDTVYHHPGAVLPRVLLRREAAAAAAIGVEDIAAFLMAQGLSAPIEGAPCGPYRQAVAYEAGGQMLVVVARRGSGGFIPQDVPPDHAARCQRAYEQWATRPRRFEDRRAGMEHTLSLAQTLVQALGVDAAAWVAFAAERVHWQQRSRAGGVQKRRQDALGLGWANHDHHTFRSSRDVFPLLIQILETFGFVARERFYAGAEAGWGAQVMEQPVCRLAVFADVDLSPDEVAGDFAHTPLAPRDELGTVGLWCALHGEAMLEAGLHHLAARLDFARAEEALAAEGVAMMQPFSDFAYLRQAFTQGERWPVLPARLEQLQEAGHIDAAQRAHIAAEGARGSHLENIQRSDGFKGFNQQNVSDIIARTDPRRSDA